jgi:hypothetical protein
MLLPKRHWSPEQNVIDTKLFDLRSHGEPKWSGADYEKARVHDLQYPRGKITSGATISLDRSPTGRNGPAEHGKTPP